MAKMKSFVRAAIAMPMVGANVQRLNPERFADNIAALIRKAVGRDVDVSVTVFKHDGTGEDTLETSDDLSDLDYSPIVREAFFRPDSYDW